MFMFRVKWVHTEIKQITKLDPSLNMGIVPNFHRFSQDFQIDTIGHGPFPQYALTINAVHNYWNWFG